MKKKMSSLILFSIIIIIISLIVEQSTIWCLAENNNVTFVGCVPRERKALLRFKASLSDPSNMLSSWNTTNHDDDDCCAWQGVECDKATGHVTELHLQNREVEIIHNDYYPFSGNDYYQSNPITTLQSKTIDSSSLLELNYLSYLDLSWNDFQGSSIPASLGSMKQLQHLNLSNANFAGIVPHQLGNLSSLRTIDLSCLYQYENYLTVDDLTWASNLSSLEYLDLSNADLSGTKDIIKVLSMLPSILVLRMSGSELDNKNLAHTCLLNSTPALFANVQHLDLSANSLEGEFPCFLHNMTSLRYLDLSENQYNFSDPPRPFMRLKNLSHLNLAVNPLNPKAFDWISDLVWDKCHLKSLNLNYYRFSGGSNYYGDLSGAFKNLSGCWIQSLETLDLRGNALEDSFYGHLFDDIEFNVSNFAGHLPEELGELKQLKELYLSGNRFSGPIPSSLGNLRALRVLFLSRNQLSGEIPISIGKLSNLEMLRISHNEFNGHLPEELGELKHLTLLVVSRNKLSGEIPISIGQLSNLEEFDASYNEFNGQLPLELGELKHLTWLDVSNNKISGPIPTSLGNLTTLAWLDLANNQLSGEVPTTLGQLSNLGWIDISHNSLEGTLSEAHFANLSKLEYLCVEYNMLKFRVGHDWVPPFQLRSLEIRSTDLGGRFPQWLQTQKALNQFDLSNCGITGMLPKWLKSSSLYDLYLPGNHIEGPIPELPSSLGTLDLSDNMITNHLSNNIGYMMPPFLDYLSLARNFINGSIPDSLCKMKSLRTLDLSGNQLSGTVPDCWGNFESLDVARLSSNRLSGAIPNSIGGAYMLRWLHLDNNIFTGPLPSTLKKCSLLTVLDVGDNKLSGKLPQWIGDHLLDLVVLRLRNNEFCGVIPSTYCQPSRLQVMDLANNNLTRNIPRCFGNFTGMVEGGSITHYETDGVEGGWFYEHLDQVIKGQTMEFTRTTTYVVNLDLSCNHLAGEIPSELTNLTGLIGLNLSLNHLGGKIPRNVGDMKSLESLDLSSNTLSGTIPQSLSKLNFIIHLDLSNNDLSGQIPTGPQLQTLDNTSNYGGNPRLCGPPLQKKCHVNDQTPRKVQNDAEHGDAEDKIYLYAFIISGLATGFWGYFGILVFKRRWRLALFRYMDVVIGKMLGRR